MLRTISRAVSLNCTSLRNVHTTALLRLREIVEEKKDEKTTVISCKYVKSPREPYILKTEDQRSEKCPLCRLRLNLKHTDVLILSQYLDTTGNVIEPWNTDLCKDQYKLVKELIYMAQYAGLLPEPERPEPKKPYRLLNTYYDEETIVLHPKIKKHNKRFFYLKQKLAPIERLRINPDMGNYFGRKIH